MAVDKEKIRELTREFLIALGEDPDRAGLVETPDRVARMCEEIFEGVALTNEDIATRFGKTFPVPEGCGMVYVKDIEIFSYCEHHIALMYDMHVSVAYIPKDKVIGLSKIARIAEMVGKRLQLQERIGSDIADIMEMVTGTEDVAVLIEGKHSCMTARGIKNTPAKTVTEVFRGAFLKDPALRDRLQ